jgi:hypothetical protein
LRYSVTCLLRYPHVRVSLAKLYVAFIGHSMEEYSSRRDPIPVRV